MTMSTSLTKDHELMLGHQGDFKNSRVMDFLLRLWRIPPKRGVFVHFRHLRNGSPTFQVGSL